MDKYDRHTFVDEHGDNWAVGNMDNFTGAVKGPAIDKLAEYEREESEGLLIHLPCKVGTCLFYLQKDCERNAGRKPEYKPSKEFQEDCPFFKPDFYECNEYCTQENRHEDYCSQYLHLHCKHCVDRIVVHKHRFTLNDVYRVYGTPQFHPQTALVDTLFLSEGAALEAFERHKEKHNAKDLQ